MVHWFDDMLPPRAFQRVARRMTLEGGKNSPPPPDYTAMAAAATHAADVGLQLGTAQQAEAKRQYDQNVLMAAPVIAAQVQAQTDANARATQQYTDYQTNTAPLIAGLSRDAQNYNAGDSIATQAGADQAQAVANMDAQRARSDASYGINPNSGRSAALTGMDRVQQAAARAGAMTSARQAAMDKKTGLMTNAASLGSGMVNNSATLSAVSNNAGNSAVANNSVAGNQYMAGLNSGAGTIMQGQGLAVQGRGNILSSQTSVYNAGIAANAAEKAGMYQAGGTVAGAAIASSDRRLKTDIILLGKGPLDLNWYEFSYRTEPGVRYRGVMADEVLALMPEAISTGADGFMRVDYAMLGKPMERVGAQGEVHNV